MTDHAAPAVDQAEQILSVISDLTPTGVYVATIALDERHLLTLDRERALRYVAAWAEAGARAEFDAAVFAQMTGIGVDEVTSVALIVHDLRPDRPPLNPDDTAPLRLEPIMSARTKRGRVDVFLGDEHLTQLDAPAVRDHIAKVLEVVHTCDLDAAYYRLAVGVLQQPQWRARAMVADLGVRWRAAEASGSDHDAWVRSQFAGIVSAATPARPATEPEGRRQPWAANRKRGKKRRGK